MNRTVAVGFENVTKTFGPVVASDKVTMEIYKGEILSLLGENGSGKTTLMNMLAGIYYPDAGHITVNGREVKIRSPKEAYALGIGMVHQHFKLVEVFSATENIVLGLEDKGKYKLKDVANKVREICERYGFDVDPNKKVYDMSVSERQTLEIVKLLYRGLDVLILDEPTAVLTPQETDKLFAVMRNMKKHGKTVIIITHKLNEVMEVSDRVAVLRHGQFIGDVPTSDTTPQKLTEMMVGHSISLNIERPEPVNPQPRVIVEDLTIVNEYGVKMLDNVSFTANSGEILGIAGISGCGQKELLEAIAGLQDIEAGKITYSAPDGEVHNLVGKDVLQIRKLGISLSFVPEDRLGMGLVGNMDLIDNVMLKSYRDGKRFFADRKSPKKLAEEIVKELDVSTPSVSTEIRKLSGGNVQKILVGREIAEHPSVLMTAYAVRGLDINTSYTIYKLLNDQKKAGVSVIYVGEDLDVLLELCDRILVLCGGRVNGILDGRTATKEEVGLRMTSMEKGGQDVDR